MLNLPELLCPAGSRAALEAAIEGGADAIYFGGSLFNARINAKNFTDEDMRASVAIAHAYGVKCYLTLNTLVYDRELSLCLEAAKNAYEAGVDALIVADLGVASAIHEYLPDLPLHASTQASGHSVAAASELRKLGFSRMVMAREASICDIRKFCKTADMELEVFVHGALCVCHSGQCLFSSMVGGRSGNRGECAQPCRLPFSVSGKDCYPLSLKDLCLAPHIPELIDAGVSSLKIEGRMKSPEYVLAVTQVYRKLLDERRAATPDEIKYLEGVFSRSGFTDGYFKGKTNSSMLGVRSESDKSRTRTLDTFSGITRKINIDMSARLFAGEPSSLTVTLGEASVTVTGDAPTVAQNRAMTEDEVKKNLSRLGGTPYSLRDLDVALGDNIMMPLSRLNALRREALAALGATEVRQTGEMPVARAPERTRSAERTARFAFPDQISEKAKKYFDILYLPLDRYNGQTNGIIMPPVIFDREREKVRSMLARAKELGAEHILIGNIGHLGLAREFGFSLHGDFRLNAANSGTVAELEALGIPDVIASTELTLPQLRDLGGDVSAIVYGRVPLMLLEKCVICELGSCRDKNDPKKLCAAKLSDRMGVSFPVFREGEHRNVIYNSLPTSMSDRQDDLAKYKISSRHFIFSVESPETVDSVINAFEEQRGIGGKARRIAK
ncbi:MAG: U32 family peptidase [Ruminococcaceae bacterium]|nr:U32 family peptidase [Oscillospiraceae bacterium]